MTLTPDELLRGCSSEIARQGVVTGPRCTARSKKRMAAHPENPELHRCGNIAEPGYTVCRWHGGKTPMRSGGRYGAMMTSLREHYVSALKDDSMLDLREPLAVLDAIAKRCIQRAEERDTPKFRARIFEYLDAARAASAAGDPADAARLLGLAYTLARDGTAEDDALREMRASIGEFADRVEKAWGVRLKQANAVNYRDLVATLARFIEIVGQECGGEMAMRVAIRVQSSITGDLMIRETIGTQAFEGAEARDPHEGVAPDDQDEPDA